MSRSIFALVLVVAALLAACSSNDKKDVTPNPTAPGASPAVVQSAVAPTAAPVGATSAASPAVSKWDKTTIFAYGFGATNDFWQQGCGKIPISINQDDPCILQVMKLANAGDSAMAFFQQQKYFLVTFEEHGRVDYGQGGAPWFSMGRPTPIVFLNGTPDVIEAKIPDDYKTNPTYAALVKPVATLPPGNIFVPAPSSPWGEYGQLTAATSSSSGQQFVVSYPLRVCRACPDDGFLPIAYNFDTQGKLTTLETLAFKPK